MNSSEVGWLRPSVTTLKVPSRLTLTRAPVSGRAGEPADGQMMWRSSSCGAHGADNTGPGSYAYHRPLRGSGPGPDRLRQRGRSLVAVGKRRPRLRRLDLDDVTAHRHDQIDQLVLLRLRDVELVERCRQMLHDDVELAGRRPHPGVRFLHAPAGVGAGAAGGLAQLVADLLQEPRDVGPGEFPVGPVIAPHAGHP